MKPLKLERPTNPYVRSQPLRSRATADELKIIEDNARKYCGGNVSEWLRLAAVKYQPEAPPTPKDQDEGDEITPLPEHPAR